MELRKINTNTVHSHFDTEYRNLMTGSEMKGMMQSKKPIDQAFRRMRDEKKIP